MGGLRLHQYAETLPMENVEEFVADADRLCHLKSQALTARIMDDETWLTDHADCTRTTIERIARLRDVLLPAWRDQPHNWSQRVATIGIMCYVLADFEAMELRLH
jgi:hypothetical protein